MNNRLVHWGGKENIFRCVSDNCVIDVDASTFQIIIEIDAESHDFVCHSMSLSIT